jgi:hypothetical protein
MARRVRTNVPVKVHGDDREVLAFYQSILDYQPFLVQTGDAIRTFRTTLADGFLTCDGSAVSRTTYATLFAQIGTTYGVGDGSTTFNLPTAAGFAIRT